MAWRVLLAVGLLAVPLSLAADSEPRLWIWSGGDVEEALGFLGAEGVPLHHYEHLAMVSFKAPTGVANGLVRHAGGSLEENRLYDLHLDGSVPYIGADDVRQAVGRQRNGPTVLVVDTGIDSRHPDFQDGNLAAQVRPDRTGGLVTGIQEPAAMMDTGGHGTHVAGIVAGSAESLGNNDALHGRFEGVYSNGRIVAFQAAAETSVGEPQIDTLAALQAFDWALANQERFDIRVVTNSWGIPGDMDPKSAVDQATLDLYLHGMTVIFSAGNTGEDGQGTLNRHCQAPWVLCVAAGDLDGKRMSFSSQGYRDREGRPYAHPDLTAPGSFIRAPRAVSQSDAGGLAGSLLNQQVSGNLYEDRSGTSMAAPHVAGTAALLVAKNPDLSPDQVMDILVEQTDPMREPLHQAGAGYLDARRAFNLAATTTGELQLFLDGQKVKYAGPQSGDRDYARDAVSFGFDSERTGEAFPLRAKEITPVYQQPLAWILAGAGLLVFFTGFTVRQRRRAPAGTTP